MSNKYQYKYGKQVAAGIAEWLAEAGQTTILEKSEVAVTVELALSAPVEYEEGDGDTSEQLLLLDFGTHAEFIWGGLYSVHNAVQTVPQPGEQKVTFKIVAESNNPDPSYFEIKLRLLAGLMNKPWIYGEMPS